MITRSTTRIFITLALVLFVFVTVPKVDQNTKVLAVARTHKGPTFDLVLNVYITNEKRVGDRNRFDRLEIFRWTLATYSKLRSLRRAVLCVELSDEYRGKKENLETYIRTLFGTRLQSLSWTRAVEQDEWRSLIFQVGGRDGDSDDIIVWFMQNDDHPFIDFNEDVLEEGLARLSDDNSTFRALYPSHWPEILNLAGKYATPLLCGSFIKVNVTILDGLQFMNFGLVRYLVDELRWSTPMRRLDTLLMDSRVWSSGTQLYDLVTLFVPLRELCRKFDGYQAQMIPAERVPYLVLPPDANKFDRSISSLIRMLTSDEPVRTLWCRASHFPLPPEFVGRIAELHMGDFQPGDGDCTQLSGEFCSAKRPFGQYKNP